MHSAINCPKCDEEMGQAPHEPDVGLTGGWYCPTCDAFVPYWDVDDELC